MTIRIITRKRPYNFCVKLNNRSHIITLAIISIIVIINNILLLVSNLGSSSSLWSKRFITFCNSIFYTTVKEFCKKIIPVVSFSSTTKNIVAFCSSLPVKLTCLFFKSDFCLLKSIAINL